MKNIMTILLLIFTVQTAFAQIDNTTKNEIRVKYETAKIHFDDGQYSKAIKKIEEAEALFKRNGIAVTPTLLSFKIKILIKQGEFREAKKQLAILQGKPKLSESIIKALAIYETQITDGVGAEKARKEQARLAALARQRKEEAERREQERILAEKMKIHLEKPVPDQTNLWFAKQNGKWGVVKGNTATKQEDYEVIIPFENDGIGYFKLWERFHIISKDRGHMLLENTGKRLTDHYIKLIIPNDFLKSVLGEGHIISCGAYKIPSYESFPLYKARKKYHVTQHLTKEKIWIQGLKKQIFEPSWKSWINIINMNGEIVLELNGFEDKAKNALDYELFAPYTGLYAVFPKDGDTGKIFDFHGNILAIVDRSWVHNDNKYTIYEDYDLAILKHGIFNINDKKSNIYYNLSGEVVFKTDYEYYNSPFNLDGIAYGVKKKGGKKNYFNIKNERVK